MDHNRRKSLVARTLRYMIITDKTNKEDENSAYYQRLKTSYR